jgi:hypothetical protein
MLNESPAAFATQGFAPLSPLLRSVDALKLDEARRRLRRLGRAELLERYRAAFAPCHRLQAYLMADALVAQGVPPFAWHEGLKVDDLSNTQRFDLFITDLLWIRRQYPDHARNVRYRRCQAVLNAGTVVFHREAEFMWYAGRRPAWKLVGSFSLTERQQWDCTFLRSTPIKKRAAATEAISERVFTALQSDVLSVRQTAAYGQREALATLRRRYDLWRCGRMVKTGSPTEIATRFEQRTGTAITRQAVAQQLEKIRLALTNIETTS